MQVEETTPPLVRSYRISVSDDELSVLLMAITKAENPQTYQGAHHYSRWADMRRLLYTIQKGC